MATSTFQRIRSHLLEQHRNLLGWLAAAPPEERELRLGPAGEEAAREHLAVLETAIEKARDETLGVCEVCHGQIEGGRLEVDYACCICLEHLSDEERSGLELQLQLSTEVQRALLPQEVPEIPGLELAAFSRPAQIVGGDYFDFFRFPDGAPGLAVGDVAGKGVSAGILMAHLQASLRALIASHDSSAEVARRLNLLLRHNVHLSKFVTLFLGRFDPPSRRLVYCNAGHNPPLVMRNGTNGHGRIDWLGSTGAAIGLVEELPYGEAAITLDPGDLLLLYTDGVTEATDGGDEEFGRERLAEVVRASAGASPRELIREILGELNEFTRGRPLTDDTTLVACKGAQ